MARAADDLCWMPASEMAPAIKRRKISPVEVMTAVLARIERLNPRLNAFVTLTAEHAMKAARAAVESRKTELATKGGEGSGRATLEDLV